MKFVAIDVETANADLASICQIGIVTFQNNQLLTAWHSLVDPEDEFDLVNISIHGIDEEMVIGAPTFLDVYDALRSRTEGEIVVSHMPFDRVAISRAAERYCLQGIQCTWLDTAKVARRTWTQFAYSGYGLVNLAGELGISFRHHDALEDARVAGEILIRAIEKSGLEITDWLDRVNKPIFEKSRGYSEKITRNGDPNGPLFGEVIVFTGTLSMPRRQAADEAAQAGCQVDSSVTQSTSILVVGNQDVRRLAGHEKSSKHRKAEELLREGQNIRILTESDFLQLLNIKA
ncbi:MAG: exonuclease domain-containing protein [Chloroflexota bacterium]